MEVRDVRERAYRSLAQISVAGGYLGVLPGLLLWALGASIGFPALAIAGLGGRKHGEEGLASGLLSTSQRIGFPLGLAILLTIAGTTNPQPLAGADTAAVVAGFQHAFLAAAILNGVGLVIALFMRNVKAPKYEQAVT